MKLNCAVTPQEFNKPGAVQIFYNSFTERNLCADYTSRRGVKKLPYNFAFIANSQNSFAVGREYYFPVNLAKQIDGHNIKAVHVASAAEMGKVNAPGVAPVDNVIGSVTGLITFRDDCNNILAQVPFADCVQNQNGGKYLFTDIPAKIENSSFTVLGGTATDGVNGIAFYFFI